MNAEKDKTMPDIYLFSEIRRKGTPAPLQDAFFKRTAHLELLTEEEARKLLDD